MYAYNYNNRSIDLNFDLLQGLLKDSNVEGTDKFGE